MSVELPIFPLNIVAFPGEEVNLHIFEPRYKQLVKDCLDEGSTFGLASHVLNKIELGTEIKITEVTKKYSDGRMDIKTFGLRIFEVIVWLALRNSKTKQWQNFIHSKSNLFPGPPKSLLPFHSKYLIN